jgi:hypothetical protein
MRQIGASITTSLEDFNFVVEAFDKAAGQSACIFRAIVNAESGPS